MNLRGPCVWGAVLLACLGLAGPRAASPEQELMLEKLAVAQKILQGLSHEDFDTIRRNAERLASLGEHPAMRGSPAAAPLGPAFAREARRLAEAARQRKIDDCASAFASMTRSCVECHTAVRGKKASLPGAGETFAAIPGPQRK
jgi:hypothetical protein